jgi:outer membrane protein
MPTRPVRAIALVLALAVARATGAQSSLADALRIADRHAYANRIAAAASRAAAAAELAPLAGALPSVHVDAGYVRTTDPIGTFGSTLRQRAITQADFAPDRLNYPAPVGNYQSGIAVEQPLFNADAWAGHQAAAHAHDASRSQEEWTRRSTRADVVRAWYGAMLASERAVTLATAVRAARAHVAQAEAMVREGLVTKSDALLAAVRAGDLDAQLAEAEAGVANARRELALLLGQGNASDVILAANATTSLPTPSGIRAVVASDTLDGSAESRADVNAAEQGLSAASADARRARSAFLPRVNAFARYDWNSSTRLYSGDKNWTVGVMASWSVVPGAGIVSEARAAASREEGAKAAADAARARANVDIAESRTTLVAALARLGIAEQAERQSAEAHRIVARKYDGGLATVAELLDAQATETASALGLANAKYGAIAAAADRRRALGRDPGTLVALDGANVVSAAPADSTTTHPTR